MANGWYYARNGKSFGPFVRAQVLQLAATGQLRPTDMLWKDGMKEWKSADAIKGLFQAPKARQRSATGEAGGSLPSFSTRTFLIGAVCGLSLGLVLGVQAPWTGLWSETGTDDREPSADAAKAEKRGSEKDLKSGEAGTINQPAGATRPMAERPAALKLASTGSKQPAPVPSGPKAPK